MNECLRSMRMTMGSAKKDHKLEVGKNYECSLEFQYVQFTQGVSGETETRTGFGVPQSSLHLICHVSLMLLLPRS